MKLRIEINNYDKYQARKDVKRAWWLKLSNMICEDPDLYDLSGEEFKAWIYILCLASKAGDRVCTVHGTQAERVCNIKKSTIMSAVKKLQQASIVTVIRTESVTDTEREWSAEEIRLDEIREDKMREEIMSESVPTISLKKLIALWNDASNTLPKCRSVSSNRKRKINSQLKRYPSFDHWQDALDKFKESKFIQEKWRPGIDAFLNEDNRLKALEGQYDDRKAKRNKTMTFQQAKTEANREAYEAIDSLVDGGEDGR